MDRLVRAPIDGVGSIAGGRGFGVLSAGLEPVATSRGLECRHVRVRLMIHGLSEPGLAIVKGSKGGSRRDGVGTVDRVAVG